MSTRTRQFGRCPTCMAKVQIRFKDSRAFVGRHGGRTSCAGSMRQIPMQPVWWSNIRYTQRGTR